MEKILKDICDLGYQDMMELAAALREQAQATGFDTDDVRDWASVLHGAALEHFAPTAEPAQ